MYPEDNGTGIKSVTLDVINFSNPFPDIPDAGETSTTEKLLRIR